MDEEYKKRIDEFFASHNFRYDTHIIGPYTSNISNHLFWEMHHQRFYGEDSTAAMIDTKCGYPTVKPNRKVLTLDIGGTNVRVAVVNFDENANPSLLSLQKMPTKDLLEKRDFFKQLSLFISPTLEKHTDIDKIAVCFSFPFEPTEDKDGVISGSAKGLNVKKLKNKKILLSLKTALKKYIDKDYSFSIINDATATLYYLSLLDKRRDNIKIAAIIGTGANSCMYLKEYNDEGRKDLWAVCTEIGHVQINPLFSSDFEKTVDASSFAPGSSQFEILTSGFYLYQVLKEILKTALNENVFNKEDIPYISSYMEGLKDTKDIDRGFDGPESIQYILNAFVERSADVIASLMGASCILVKYEKLPDSKDVSILIEGSTYYLLPHYKERSENAMRCELEELGYNPTFYYPVDNKGTIVLYGTAIAGE